MARNKRFKTHVYRLWKKAGKPTITDAFERLFAMTPGELRPPSAPASDNRWGLYQGTYLDLDHLHKYKVHVGAVHRLRMSDLDSVADHKNSYPDVIKPSQGLGRHAAFIWDESESLLWFQRDSQAVGITAFLDYVRYKTQIWFGHKPVYDKATIERALSMKTITKINVALEGPELDDVTLDTAAGDLAELEALRKKYGAAQIEIFLRPSENGALSGAAPHRLVTKLAKLIKGEKGNVGKAWVGGSFEAGADEEDEFLNLLHAKVEFSLDVPEGRFAEANSLMSIIREIWSRDKDKIGT